MTKETDIVAENEQIFESGIYEAEGQTFHIAGSIRRAIDRTVMYEPDVLMNIVKCMGQFDAVEQNIRVTNESTEAAARRISLYNVGDRVALLNFASARRPGGGYLQGAIAQEEDLARASCLYPCLLTQPKYYEENRMDGTNMYTDRIIYSPDVVFFRSNGVLAVPYNASVITAPAPNKGELLSRCPDAGPYVISVMHRRMLMILLVAIDNEIDHLVLGAWGCGVFKNNPKDVARLFKHALYNVNWPFTTVTFAILDDREKKTLNAFTSVFSGDGGNR